MRIWVGSKHLFATWRGKLATVVLFLLPVALLLMEKIFDWGLGKILDMIVPKVVPWLEAPWFPLVPFAIGVGLWINAAKAAAQKVEQLQDQDAKRRENELLEIERKVIRAIHDRFQKYDQKLDAFFRINVEQYFCPKLLQAKEDLLRIEEKVHSKFAQWAQGQIDKIPEELKEEKVEDYRRVLALNEPSLQTMDLIGRSKSLRRPTGEEISAANPPHMDKIDHDGLQLAYKKWQATMTIYKEAIERQISGMSGQIACDKETLYGSRF